MSDSFLSSFQYIALSLSFTIDSLVLMMTLLEFFSVWPIILCLMVVSPSFHYLSERERKCVCVYVPARACLCFLVCMSKKSQMYVHTHSPFSSSLPLLPCLSLLLELSALMSCTSSLFIHGIDWLVNRPHTRIHCYFLTGIGLVR